MCRPPLAHNSWRHHHHERQQHQSPSRERSPRWEDGDGRNTADHRHLRGTALSPVGDDDLVDSSSSSRRDDTGRRRSRHGGGGSMSHSEVGARGGGSASDTPRPWELNASPSRGTPCWESERRRLSRRDEGVEEEEDERLEAYRTRATAAVLLGATEKSADVNSSGVGGSRTGQHGSGGRDELCPDDGGGRRSASFCPSGGSKAAGRGHKRFRRDLDEEGGTGIGRGSLVSSDGVGAGAGGAGSRSAAEDRRETKNPP